MDKSLGYQTQEMIALDRIPPFQRNYHFPDKDQKTIKDCVLNNQPQVQELLKLIHQRFTDEGLRYTLIHKLFAADDQSLQYYVPELVYIAVKKLCKPMRKFLISKTSRNQNLCRLIFWNLKAFTVLMKQKDEQLKKFVNEFEQNINKSLKDKNNFTHAQKAISMLTTASLILKQFQKKLPQGVKLKDKLKRFIKRFNSQYLNNINHNIVIPFRKNSKENFHSNYVVGIVQNDCSCFPTRKRVPYRIIIQTIDKGQTLTRQHNHNLSRRQKIGPEENMDLFDEVTKSVDKMFTEFYKLVRKDSLFVVDKEADAKIRELQNYAKKVDKQQHEIKKQRSIGRKMTKTHHQQKLPQKQLSEKSRTSIQKENYIVQDNQNLKKFNAIYISTIPSTQRKTVTQANRMERSLKKINIDKKTRWSGKEDQEDQGVKIVEQQTIYGLRTTDSVWGQSSHVKTSKFKQVSYFSNFKTLRMHNVVVKGGDDLRQQIICMQLIYKMRDIIVNANIDVVIKPYEIIVLSENSGLLQFVPNSISLDGLKKQKEQMSLIDFFDQAFTQTGVIIAKNNFIKSLVGSSVLTYVLKLKDRHNGNILLDNQGNIIHIDFGFILGMSPGGVNFQTSPFKFTEEYLDLIGGKDSDEYELFKKLFCDSMLALRKRSQELCLILEIMMEASDLQCFQKFEIYNFRDRFKPYMNDENYRYHCEDLVERSCLNSRTAHYDYFQFLTNGILR